MGAVLLQVGFGPPFPIPTRRRGEEGEGRRKGGPPPSPIRFGLGGAHLGLPPLFHHLAHEAQ